MKVQLVRNVVVGNKKNTVFIRLEVSKFSGLRKYATPDLCKTKSFL